MLWILLNSLRQVFPQYLPVDNQVGGRVKERNTRYSLYQRGVDTFLFTSSFDFTQQIENLSLGMFPSFGVTIGCIDPTG